MLHNVPAVGSDNACAFLPSVLKGIKTEVGQLGSVLVAVNGEDAAFFART
jgi:hypothetical protein